MPTIDVNGIGIAYEIVGVGPRNAIITPGGRYSKDFPGVRELAQEIAKGGYKVIIWDRPNCGESDICFEGESESIVNADTLAGLLRALGMAPALVFGGSAGSRVSLLAALRHPEVVERLALLWITGGITGLAALVGVYCGELVRDARLGGMAAVANSTWLSECVRRNPANRERLLAWDVEPFVERLEQWAKTLLPVDGSPVPGFKPEDWSALKMPVLVFRSGVADFSHPRKTTDEVHALIPHSQMIDPPWGDREWADRMEENLGTLFRRWPMVAPQVLQWATS